MSQHKPPIYLSETALSEMNITTDEVIDSIEHLVLGLKSKKVWLTPKSVIQPGDGRYIMSTLSASDDRGYVAVKSVVLNPKNPQKGLPQINGLIMLLSSESGIPLAVIDGNWITAIRTAGVSAMIARRLARKNSKVICFIGSGVQAQSHLKLYRDLFPIKQVRVYGRGQENRDKLCQAATDLGYEAIDCTDPQHAVAGADLVVSSVTMTAKIAPFINPHWLKPGVFLTATDMALPFMPDGMDAFDRIIIDDIVQEQAMPEKMLAEERISGDISGLINHEIKGRSHDRERCALIFRAVALGDLALSALAYDKARELNRGA